MQCLCAAINALPAPAGIVLRRDAEALHGKMHLCIPALFGRHAPELWPQRTANNQPFLSPRESDIEKPPMLLRSEDHTSELQSLTRNSYAVFCLQKKTNYNKHINHHKRNYK